jgi:fucose permease
MVPDRVLGRVNATLETFSHGIAYPIGALAAAAIAGVVGLRGGIAIGWAGMAISLLLLVFSPLPRIRKASDFIATEV